MGRGRADGSKQGVGTCKVTVEVGRQGGQQLVCLLQEEILEKQLRQTEGEGKLPHICNGFHSVVMFWVERDVEAGSRKGDLDG